MFWLVTFIPVVSMLFINPQMIFLSHFSESAAQTAGPREVILSEYLIGK